MAPVILVTLASIAWGGKGLSKTLSRCKDLNYDDTCKMLKRLVMLVVVLVMLVMGILAAQVMDKPGKGTTSWQPHMLWGDAAGELVHLIVLVSLMILCQPDPTTFKADEYVTSQGDGEMKGAPCAQDDDERVGILDLEEMHGDELGPTADTIGAPTSQAAE